MKEKFLKKKFAKSIDDRFNLCYHTAMENRSEVTPIGKYDTQTEWAKSNTTFIGLKLNNNTDKPILDWLSKQPSKQGAIKKAIQYYLLHSHCDK